LQLIKQTAIECKHGTLNASTVAIDPGTRAPSVADISSGKLLHFKSGRFQIQVATPTKASGTVRKTSMEALTASWHSGQALTVTETMSLSVAGAPATVHRKLTNLKKQGLVSVHESDIDLRVRMLVPTRRALDYFERLAACLEDAKLG
jgi:hypothetical protein